MKLYKIKTTKIRYFIEEEDLEFDEFENHGMDADDYDDEVIEEMIEEVQSQLPQELEFEIDCDPDELEDLICENISDETGYLVDWFKYEIVSEEELEGDDDEV
jgi:hypothetical protein